MSTERDAAAVAIFVVLAVAVLSFLAATNDAPHPDKDITLDGKPGQVQVLIDRSQGKQWKVIVSGSALVVIPGSERPYPDKE